MRLADRIPPDDERLAALDARTSESETRRALLAKPPSKSTARVYGFWLRQYKDWALAEGYQWDLAFLTDVTATEFTRYLVRRRYAPFSIRTALSALRWQALKLGLRVMPTFDEARGVYDQWVLELNDRKEIVSVDYARVIPKREA